MIGSAPIIKAHQHTHTVPQYLPRHCDIVVTQCHSATMSTTMQHSADYIVVTQCHSATMSTTMQHSATMSTCVWRLSHSLQTQSPDSVSRLSLQTQSPDSVSTHSLQTQFQTQSPVCRLCVETESVDCIQTQTFCECVYRLRLSLRLSLDNVLLVSL